MKILAITTTLFFAINSYAAQVGTLTANHNYDVYLDGTFVSTKKSANSIVTIDLPNGKHTIQLIDMGPAPTQTPRILQHTQTQTTT